MNNPFRDIAYEVIMALILIVGGTSCNYTGDNVLSAKVIRLETGLVSYDSLTEQRRSILTDSLTAGYDDMLSYFRERGLADSSVISQPNLEKSLAELAHNPIITVFGPDVMKRYVSVDTVAFSLGGVDKNIALLLPEVKVLPYYTFITPYKTPYFATPRGMYIALNHYLGSDYEGYDGFPDYLVRNMRPEMIPYDVTDAYIRIYYPLSGYESATALARMIYEGAIVYAKMKCVPDASLHDALGYTQDELERLHDNESDVWGRLVSGELLYTTDTGKILGLTSVSPSSSFFSDEIPGGAGRYIGYRIVERYLENDKDATLDSLLKSDLSSEAVDILRLSRYIGK